MNGRTAKRLRRVAESTTLGLPARRLVSRMKQTKSRTLVFFINDPGTTRGRYRDMKRMWRERRDPKPPMRRPGQLLRIVRERRRLARKAAARLRRSKS